MLIGYMRASDADSPEALDLQRDPQLDAAADLSRLYEDRASGRRADRPGLEACPEELPPGATLVAWRFDRLGRDLGLFDLSDGLTGVAWLRTPLPRGRRRRQPHAGRQRLCLNSELPRPPPGRELETWSLRSVV
jgi:DNA invertase Pin-like site-specific DNA recombinase